MELSARGWGRDHGKNVIAEKDLATAKVGKFKSYFKLETYITSVPELAHGYPVRRRIIQNGSVEIRFGAKVVLNGDYLIRLTLTKEEIGKLFRLQYAESTIEEISHLFGVNAQELPDQMRLAAIQEASAFNPLFLKKVDAFRFLPRTVSSLKNENIIYVGDLVRRTEADLLRTPNFGRKSLNEVKETLVQVGLHLGMEVPGWPPENIEELAQRFASV